MIRMRLDDFFKVSVRVRDYVMSELGLLVRGLAVKARVRSMLQFSTLFQ